MPFRVNQHRLSRNKAQVAEVAKTLDSVPAMHPIYGQIGYHFMLPKSPPAATSQSLVAAYKCYKCEKPLLIAAKV